MIIKKIPKHGHSSHLPVEHKVPSFKPIKHAGPSFGTLIGKFFKASTSLKPGEPAPFDDHDVYYPDPAHSHSDHEDHHEESFSSNVKYHESPPPSDEIYPESYHKHHKNPPHSYDEYNEKENPSLIYHKDKDFHTSYKKYPESILPPSDHYHKHIPEIYYRHKENPSNFYEKFNIKDKEIPPPLAHKRHPANISPPDDKYRDHLSDTYYHDNKDNSPVSYHKFHKSSSPSHDDRPPDHDVHFYATPPSDNHQYLSASKPKKSNKNILKPPSTSYGSPFEEEPEYLHQDTSESKESVNIAQLPSQQPSLAPTQLPSSAPLKHDNIHPLPDPHYLSESEIRNFSVLRPFNTPVQYFTDDIIPTNEYIADASVLSSALPSISLSNASTAFKKMSTVTPIEIPTNQVFVPPSPETKLSKTANSSPIAVFPTPLEMSFQKLPTVSPTNAVPNIIVPSLHPKELHQIFQPTFFSPAFNNQNLGPSPRASLTSSQSSDFKHPENTHTRPARSKNSVRRRFPAYEVIKSVSFQLGSNRLKRL